MDRIKIIYSKNKKLIIALAQLALVAVVFWFLYGKLEAGLAQAADTIRQLHWQLFVATLLFTLAVVVSGSLWGMLVNHLGSHDPIDSLEAVRVHTLAWLLKYLPGQGGGVVSKLLWAKKNQIERQSILTSILYENILLVSSSLILSVPLLGFAALQSLGKEEGLLLPILMSLLVLPLLIPSVFTFCIRLGLRLIGRNIPRDSFALTGLNVLRAQLLYLLPRLINGVGFVLIVSIFTSLNTGDIFQLSGAYVLAGVIGILAFFVPSGIGVREAVIVVTTSSILGRDSAVAAALLARVFATIADVILAVIYGGLQLRYGKTKSSDH